MDQSLLRSPDVTLVPADARAHRGEWPGPGPRIREEDDIRTRGASRHTVCARSAGTRARSSAKPPNSTAA